MPGKLRSPKPEISGWAIDAWHAIMQWLTVGVADGQIGLFPTSEYGWSFYGESKLHPADCHPAQFGAFT